MKSNQTNLLVFNSALLVISTLSQQTGRCFDVSENKHCFSCYRSKPNGLKPGCGPLLPDSDPCSIYNYNNDKMIAECEVCKPGFAVQNDYGNKIPTCIQGSVQGCQFEVSIPGVNLCFACHQPGYYAQRTASLFDIACKPLPEGVKPIENCQWGGTYNPKQKEFGCYKCKAGYTLSQDHTMCTPWKIPGCSFRSGNSCTTCDAYDGWSMQPDGTCLKSSSSQ